jgi:hypothetical protein
MKRLLFLGACLVALASQPVVAQTGGADIVVVRVNEYNGSTHLAIERGGKTPEYIDFKWQEKPEKNQSAATGYYVALVKLYQQGYQVQAVIPGIAGSAGYSTTTLIFAKPVTK